LKVRISRSAERDLREIAEYIAQDSPLRAFNFVRYLRQKALELGQIPQAFPLIPRYEKFGLRRRPCGYYLIIYRIDNGAVRIVRIVHGARDYESWLFPH
jgi:plasmid stabilization system protein ParE